MSTLLNGHKPTRTTRERKAAAKQCAGTIEKEWPGHASALWRRRCGSRTRHESGYCQHHRITHATVRR